MGQFTDRNPDLDLAMDSKAMLAKANKEKRVIKYNDRVKLKVLKDTRFYREGQVINPHRLVAEELVANKIAKEIK